MRHEVKLSADDVKCAIADYVNAKLDGAPTANKEMVTFDIDVDPQRETHDFDGATVVFSYVG